MDVPRIHCHVASDKSTVPYVEFMWETMRALAAHPDAVKLSIHSIGPTAADRLGHLSNSVALQVPSSEMDKGTSGSTAHGICLEHALLMTDDGDIHILVDSDTVVLARGWDDYIRIQMLDRAIGCVGTTYEDAGGFSSGPSSIQTYKGVPTITWMSMSPLFSWRGLKAMPKKDENLHVANETMSKVYGLPVGHHVLRDVAWQIPDYLYTHGISYTGWRQLKPSKDAVVLRGLSDYHEEYHVADGVPFVVHHRGSRNHAYRGDKVSQDFFGAVDRWLVDEKQREPRWRWEPNESNRAALEQIVARSEELRSRPAMPSTSMTSAGAGASIDGWLKATLDGQNVWNRYVSPVPSQVVIALSPGIAQHLRLEGTVQGLTVRLPSAPDRAYSLTVRNMTPKAVTVAMYDNGKMLSVPSDACYLVLVDVDGVVHVG